MYAEPGTDPCYPPGEYSYEDVVDVGVPDGALRERRLAVTIAIDDDGRLSVDTE